MLLSIAGALIAAAAVVTAAHAVRERRAMAADLQALRADLRRLSRALEARSPAGTPEVAIGPTPGPGGADRSATAEEQAVQARGTRTVH